MLNDLLHSELIFQILEVFHYAHHVVSHFSNLVALRLLMNITAVVESFTLTIACYLSFAAMATRSGSSCSLIN